MEGTEAEDRDVGRIADVWRCREKVLLTWHLSMFLRLPLRVIEING